MDPRFGIDPRSRLAPKGAPESIEPRLGMDPRSRLGNVPRPGWPRLPVSKTPKSENPRFSVGSWAKLSVGGCLWCAPAGVMVNVSEVLESSNSIKNAVGDLESSLEMIKKHLFFKTKPSCLFTKWEKKILSIPWNCVTVVPGNVQNLGFIVKRGSQARIVIGNWRIATHSANMHLIRSS